MAAVKIDDLRTAFEYVNSVEPGLNAAYVCTKTGRIFWTSESNDLDEEELPEDFETADHYLALPHKNDLDLGRELVMRFVERDLPGSVDRVTDFFRHRGAYARFRDLLQTTGTLDRWYRFEEDETVAALRAWCAENGIEIDDGTDEAGT